MSAKKLAPTSPPAPPAEPPFILPDPLEEGEYRHVAPLTERTAEPVAMIRDLLGGNLPAGFALRDWLRERGETDLDRRAQYGAFSKLLRVLVRVAMVRASTADLESAALRQTPQGGQWGQPTYSHSGSFAERVARDWGQFTAKVVELFVFDLYEVADCVRFVEQVLRPGQVGSTGEGEGEGGE